MAEQSKFNFKIWGIILLLVIGITALCYVDLDYGFPENYKDGEFFYTQSDGTCQMKVVGTINEELEGKFKSTIETIKKSGCKKISLTLNSTGGNANVALRLGELVAQEKMTTSIEKVCSSACPFIFIAGKERIIKEPARFGFHQAINTETDTCISPTLKLDEEDKKYLAYSEEFIKRMLTKEAANYFLSKENVANCKELLTADNVALTKYGVSTKLIKAPE